MTEHKLTPEELEVWIADEWNPCPECRSAARCDIQLDKRYIEYKCGTKVWLDSKDIDMSPWCCSKQLILAKDHIAALEAELEENDG